MAMAKKHVAKKAAGARAKKSGLMKIAAKVAKAAKKMMAAKPLTASAKAAAARAAKAAAKPAPAVRPTAAGRISALSPAELLHDGRVIAGVLEGLVEGAAAWAGGAIDRTVSRRKPRAASKVGARKAAAGRGRAAKR